MGRCFGASERDALIAVTGLVLGMAVVTHNVAYFDIKGIRFINPWTHSDISIDLDRLFTKSGESFGLVVSGLPCS